jgi:hypothetical protein
LWAARKMRPLLPGSKAADPWNGPLPVHIYEGPKAMAGSPDAEAAVQRCCADSVSPSCLWLSRFRENHERKSQCLIFTRYNLTGVAVI